MALSVRRLLPVRPKRAGGAHFCALLDEECCRFSTNLFRSAQEEGFLFSPRGVVAIHIHSSINGLGRL
jgi:hypothetical protein